MNFRKLFRFLIFKKTNAKFLKTTSVVNICANFQSIQRLYRTYGNLYFRSEKYLKENSVVLFKLYKSIEKVILKYV